MNVQVTCVGDVEVRSYYLELTFMSSQLLSLSLTLNIQASWNTLDVAQPDTDQDSNKNIKNETPTIVRSPKIHPNKRKSKGMPVRGRRLKTMNSGHGSKSRFSVDVNSVSKRHQKSSSAFDIQQNDIRRLDALMRSLSENRQN